MAAEYTLMLQGGSLFNFDSPVGIASILISVVLLLILGYLIKGIEGAIIAFSTGTLLFLYFKGLLPI